MMIALLSVRRHRGAAATVPRPSILQAGLLLLLAATAAAASEAAAAKNQTKPAKVKLKPTKPPTVSSPGEAEARYAGAVRGDDVWTPPPTTVDGAADGDGGGGGKGPCKTAIERMLSPVRRKSCPGLSCGEHALCLRLGWLFSEHLLFLAIHVSISCAVCGAPMSRALSL